MSVIILEDNGFWIHTGISVEITKRKKENLINKKKSQQMTVEHLKGT